MQCRTPQFVGVAVYQAFPMADNGYVLAMRSAYTAPGQWARDGEVASAAARSMRCNVPFKPSSFDYTSRPPSAGKSPKGKGNADSQYSRWLGMEHYHDSGTGQNYWVSEAIGPRAPQIVRKKLGAPVVVARWNAAPGKTVAAMVRTARGLAWSWAASSTLVSPRASWRGSRAGIPFERVIKTTYPTSASRSTTR